MANVKLHNGLTDNPIPVKFATTLEAAHYLKMGRSWVYQQMHSGRLAYARFGRARRIPWTAIEKLAKDCMVGDAD